MNSDESGGVLSRHLHTGLTNSLRHLTKSWFRGSKADADSSADAPPDTSIPHSYSHVSNKGEMNHMGQYECELCHSEMSLETVPVVQSIGTSQPESEIQVGTDVQWKCSRCGNIDDSSFRICTKCGKKTVTDKFAASARTLPVSLNAGGCTDCERCIICSGFLAIGNLMWFHGRWTHSYPSPEFDRDTGEQIMVMRERSSTYAFHSHHSCFEKNPKNIESLILARAPEWYIQGEAEQRAGELERLRDEGKCLICKNPLTIWDKLLERDTHRQCG